jgi:hypothetical protein
LKWPQINGVGKAPFKPKFQLTVPGSCFAVPRERGNTTAGDAKQPQQAKWAYDPLDQSPHGGGDFFQVWRNIRFNQI